MSLEEEMKSLRFGLGGFPASLRGRMRARSTGVNLDPDDEDIVLDSSDAREQFSNKFGITSYYPRGRSCPRRCIDHVRDYFVSTPRAEAAYSLICLFGWVVALLAVTISGISAGIVLEVRGLPPVTCPNSCKYRLVESIPTGINLQHGSLSIPTHEAITNLADGSISSLHMLQFYFDLNNSAAPLAHGDYGLAVYNSIIAAARRDIDVKIVYNAPSSEMPDTDINAFRSAGAIAKAIDFNKIWGRGVLHTKIVISDSRHFYIGSSNMDWKSLSQVKELGILVENCECIGDDVERIFQVFWQFLDSGFVDQSYDTDIYMTRPLLMDFVEGMNPSFLIEQEDTTPEITEGHVYISSSPPFMNTMHRTDDISALVDVIRGAEEFVFGSVMDFLPCMYYSKPPVYWAEIQDALKDAILTRGLEIRLLVSRWNHTSEMERPFLQSLAAFGDVCNTSKVCNGSITVQEFFVPDDPHTPVYSFTRVNHAKYIVTDRQVFISTSNWSKDYFYDTAGASFVSSHRQMARELKEVFLRDWDSEYAYLMPMTKDETSPIDKQIELLVKEDDGEKIGLYHL